jgi:hypothetical protein
VAVARQVGGVNVVTRKILPYINYGGEARQAGGVHVVTGRERFYLTSITGIYFLFDDALSRKCFNP